MELDELKILLKAKIEEQIPAKSTDELALLLNNKTQSVIEKLRRSLRIEIITAILFTVVFSAVGIFAKYVSLQIYFSAFAFVCFLFIIVLWFLHKKIKQLSSTPQPVKRNLQTISAILKEYVKRYFQLTMILIPLTVIISFSLGYSDENLYNPQLHNSGFFTLTGSAVNIILIFVYIIVFGVSMYYFTKWYLKKLYGNYLEQLQQLITELEEL